MNGVLMREAGDKWSELGPQDEIMIFRMRVVSNGTVKRFVQSATRGMLPRTVNGMDTMVPNYVIRVSDDDGATWDEFPFEAPDSGSFLLAGVDPSNPDRMVAVVDRDEMSGNDDTLLVSLDGGQTFSEYLTLADFSGVAFLPDGTVFIGDRGSLLPDKPTGMWKAASLAEAATQLQADWNVGCISYDERNDTLWACEQRGFGKLDRDTGTLDRLMKFDEVQSILECPGVDVVGACQAQLCKDYCLLGHFPETPACAVYQTPNCGPCSLRRALWSY